MHRHLLTTFLVWTAFLGATLSAQSVEEFDRDDPPGPETPQQVASPMLDQVEQAIVRRTNRFRENNDLSALDVNQQLQEAAEYFADFMARTGKYGHTADGQRPSERARQHGYEFCIVSENIAYQYSSAGFETQELAQGFVQGWKNSPGHRENMLDPHVTETGVGVAHSDQTGSYFGVQMFGRPRSASIHFRVVNRAGEAVEYTVSPSQRGQSRSFDLPSRVTRTHERCRPSRIEFSFDESLSVKAEDGVGYVVDTNDSGELTVLREQLAGED